MERKTLHFKGNVQGVGFRQRTVLAAQGLPLTGYVQNLPNGHVRCVVEGEASPLNTFLKSLHQAQQHYIEDTHITTGTATGSFENFTIQH